MELFENIQRQKIPFGILCRTNNVLSLHSNVFYVIIKDLSVILYRIISNMDQFGHWVLGFPT